MRSSLESVRPARPRPALRLVDTRRIERDDWLEVRKAGIGGSDAAAAVGLNPYKSALALWLEKTGRDANLEKPDPKDTTQPVFWGSLLEPIVAAAYTQQTGRRVRKVNAVLQHPTVPFMLANLDREVVGVPGVQILECKTAGEFGARLWRNGVPEYVQLQVQHQLAVTGKQAADVAVLLCGQKLEVFRIHRDDELIARLIELEAQFWAYVTSDTPPPADGSDSAEKALRCLYPQDTGTTIDFSHDRILSAAFADLQSVRQKIDDLAGEEAKLKQRLQQAMGGATKAIFETGEISWKRSKDSRSIDLERILGDHPALREQYAMTKPGSRRFTILA
ncbi:YqaJ-like viral recombinase domain protein [Pigmentiphaga humi]|uniref:YqaJ-like viral recombinase domain protein n=1 Tax=Pigmentiphaga humi TaxID=2478468 RepID=A0A3P4B8A8_9BURK|nr:YqaJ viral recombinase family protein [Pigmentiphaga humi]VCU72504.1 YqaJ-like viral recombinase domain protein [Pigmentiphaga humi]